VKFLLSFLLFAVLQNAAAAGLYDTLDDMRSGRSHCPATAQNIPALRPVAALDQAARELARGGGLEQSFKQSGYRFLRTSAINFSGDFANAGEYMARKGYCRQLQDAGLSEVGLYQDARQLWIVLAAPYAPSAGVSTAAGGRYVLDLVNQARARARSCGGTAFAAAPPLRWNDLLALASQRHADDMARSNYFSHAGRDGSNPGVRAERAGYRYRAVGENIAAGTQMTPEVAVAGWIKSPGHCANLMNATFTEMGAAFATDARSEMGVYWAQAFGAPR